MFDSLKHVIFIIKLDKTIFQTVPSPEVHYYKKCTYFTELESWFVAGERELDVDYVSYVNHTQKSNKYSVPRKDFFGKKKELQFRMCSHGETLARRSTNRSRKPFSQRGQKKFREELSCKHGILSVDQSIPTQGVRAPPIDPSDLCLG